MEVVRRIGEDLYSTGWTLPYYECSPTHSVLVKVFNQFTALYNEGNALRASKYFRIIDNAEADLETLSVAKGRLVEALRRGPSPATTQARLDYRDAVAKLRQYKLHDFAVVGGRSFKAADFWGRANAAMYQDIGDDYSGLTVEEVLGGPQEANLRITTGNAIAPIEVRHMSYGPGFCTVETSTSLGKTISAAAPPLVYGPWIRIEAHIGIVSMTISTRAQCDTGARTQVRYFK